MEVESVTSNKLAAIVQPTQVARVSGDRRVEEFCADCRLRGMTEESVRRYGSSVLTFVGFLNGKGVNAESINAMTLREFLCYLRERRKVSQKTVENCFSALSSFYDYLQFEGIISSNVVVPFRRRYLRTYKEDYSDPERRLLTIEEMGRLANSILDPRDKAIALLLAKTGIRRGELLRTDLEDVNWRDYSITLKPAAKRSNRVVFFDDECAMVLKRWLAVREKLKPRVKALFVSYQSLNRLDRNGCYEAVVKYARRLGFHDPKSRRLEDHFGPHCFRHFFTTFLLRNGMPREYVKELRGDSRREAIDIYNHIDREELRKAYLACVPKLRV
jgi:integrase/recombinase XerD